MPRIILQIHGLQLERFTEFLSQNQQIESFQKMGSYFILKTTHKEKAQFTAFLNWLKESFFIQDIRPLCFAKCRDDTDCLNIAVEGGFCWKHQK